MATADIGVDPEKALAVINSGSGQNSATLTKIPNFILNRRFADMQAPMHIVEKDAMLWRMEAERLEAPPHRCVRGLLDHAASARDGSS